LVGDEMFFVISGYVITALLQREWDRKQSLDLRRFSLRRFKRLTPTLALAVSATAMISIFVLSHSRAKTPRH
jgi:peptidoglycan/LPS O-acetylase OafA/YrhL